MGRSGNGAFPGAAGLLVSSFLSSPLPDDGRLATGRNTPSGVSQEAEQSRASSDTRWPCIIFLAARKDGQHGTAHWRGRPLGQFGDKARFDSAPFQEDGSLVGPRQREREKDRFDSCPSSPSSRFTIHDSLFTIPPPAGSVIPAQWQSQVWCLAGGESLPGTPRFR